MRVLASVTMSRCVRAHECVSKWVRACMCTHRTCVRVRVYVLARLSSLSLSLSLSHTHTHTHTHTPYPEPHTTKNVLEHEQPGTICLCEQKKPVDYSAGRARRLL